MKVDTGAAVVAPSIGPAVITFLGWDIPVLALALAVMGLLLARTIAPPPLRKLTRGQHAALTALLGLVVFLFVTGQITGKPLEPGMATMLGIGLGFSGLAAIELVAARGMAALRAFMGKADES